MENEILQQILNKLDSLEQGQATMQVELNEVKQRQVRTEGLIENETNPNIRAIAEVYGDHTERLNRIETKIEHLSVTSDVHEVVLRTIAK